MKVFYITVSLLLQWEQLLSSSCSSATLSKNADKKISYFQYLDTTRTYYSAYQAVLLIQTAPRMRQRVQKWGQMHPKPDSCWGKWEIITAAWCSLKSRGGARRGEVRRCKARRRGRGEEGQARREREPEKGSALRSKVVWFRSVLTNTI